MPLKILLFGSPGAGKDTQADILSEKLDIFSFSLGQILRDEFASGTDLGREVVTYFERGELVPNEIANSIMRSKLLDPAVQARGYIVNGYPRKVSTFQDYITFDTPTIAIHLIVSADEAKKRLKHRQRNDDTSNLIEKKIARYHETEKAVCEYIQANTKISYVEINGSLPQEKVTEMILTHAHQ